MVRVNLIKPSSLTDQHLVAEYLEILMLLGYVKKHPSLEGIPSEYTLGKGHIKFFKNKLRYLQRRHEMVKKEMKKRGFKTDKSVKIGRFKKELCRDWRPKENDKRIIKKRLSEKIRMKPSYYKYYGEKKSKTFYLNLIKKG